MNSDFQTRIARRSMAQQLRFAHSWVLRIEQQEINSLLSPFYLGTKVEAAAARAYSTKDEATRKQYWRIQNMIHDRLCRLPVYRR